MDRQAILAARALLDQAIATANEAEQARILAAIAAVNDVLYPPRVR